jgi:hypothetical protein
MLVLANKNPKIYNYVQNDEILFLIACPYVAFENGCGSEVIPFGFINTGAMVIPRSDIENFRKVFVNTYTRYKYKVTTLRHFKYLQRKYIFGFDGKPLENGWDVSMDAVTFKKENLLDADRKILMPDSWIKESIGCYFYKLRQEAYDTRTTGSSPPVSTQSLGFIYEKFADFKINE